MNISKQLYITYILLHIVLGFVLFYIPFFSKIYGIAIPLIGFIYVIRKQNRNNEVLIVAAYIVGGEVLLRATGGNVFYEFSKYGVIVFALLGMFYSGFSKNAIPIWIYILLLVPGIIIATETLNLSTEIRTTISFNISGPICLGVASIYTYFRKISLKELNTILLAVGLPIISTVIYLILYTPDLKDVLISTGSNYDTSGGFGPNQVATVLGLGMFVFFSRLFLQYEGKLIFFINLMIVFFISYRGLITFSRGGMITGFTMILVFIFLLYGKVNRNGRFKLNILVFFSVVLVGIIWVFTLNRTDGLIQKRYSNEDAMGRKKESNLTGREDILQKEIDIFLENPIFGVGVAKGMEVRGEITGTVVVSHNEISRTLAEHGALGIMALLIVFLTPIFLYLDNKHNPYVFCFVLFWLLTINHAAMRLAAPAFIYSLTLLKVFINEDDIVHRE